MNIEIANRLVELRKKNGYSQEELASRLGLSRQAVSKWERAEASPDTDNLICLAKLYGVSLDDLLKTDDDIETIVEEQGKETVEAEKVGNGQKKNEDSVCFSDGNLHIENEDGEEVHIGKDGIHIRAKDGNVDLGGDISDSIKSGAVKVNVKTHSNVLKIVEGCVTGAMALIVTIIYITLGCLYDGVWPDPLVWKYLWVLYLLLPLTSSVFETIRLKKASPFTGAVVFIVLIAFFTLGFFLNAWHPGWVLFLAIPVYGTIAGGIDKALEGKRKTDQVVIDINPDDEDKND